MKKAILLFGLISILASFLFGAAVTRQLVGWRLNSTGFPVTSAFDTISLQIRTGCGDSLIKDTTQFEHDGAIWAWTIPALFDSCGGIKAEWKFKKNATDSAYFPAFAYDRRIADTIDANIEAIDGDLAVAESLEFILDGTGANLRLNHLTIASPTSAAACSIVSLGANGSGIKVIGTGNGYGLYVETGFAGSGVYIYSGDAPLTLQNYGASEIGLMIAGDIIADDSFYVPNLISQISNSTFDPATDLVQANIKSISDDTTVADSLEGLLDGTGARLTVSTMDFVGDTGIVFAKHTYGIEGDSLLGGINLKTWQGYPLRLMSYDPTMPAVSFSSNYRPIELLSHGLEWFLTTYALDIDSLPVDLSTVTTFDTSSLTPMGLFRTSQYTPERGTDGAITSLAGIATATNVTSAVSSVESYGDAHWATSSLTAAGIWGYSGSGGRTVTGGDVDSTRAIPPITATATIDTPTIRFIARAVNDTISAHHGTGAYDSAPSAVTIAGYVADTLADLHGDCLWCEGTALPLAASISMGSLTATLGGSLRANIKLYYLNTLPIEITILDAGHDTVDITGDTIWFKVRVSERETTTVFADTFNLDDPTNGHALITVSGGPGGDTEAFECGEDYIYDITIIHDGVEYYTTVKGILTILENNLCPED